MMNLFVSYYNQENKDRQHEIATAISKNIESKLFDNIYILLEPGTDNLFKDVEGVTTIVIARPTFQDFFDTMNRFTENEDVNIISNSDIVFDGSIQLANVIKDFECYALSRYEMSADFTKQYTQVQIHGDSQDVWIFKGAFKFTEKKPYADFPMGKMGCDNRIAHEIGTVYKVTNPAKSIQTWHLHNVNSRGYDNQVRNEHTVVPPPYLTIPITSL